MQAIDVMRRDVIAVAPDDTVVDAARRMIERRVSGLPVVDARAHLAGLGGARPGDRRTVEYR